MLSDSAFLSFCFSEVYEQFSKYVTGFIKYSERSIKVFQKNLTEYKHSIQILGVIRVLIDFFYSLEMKEDPIDTWKGGSFLSAVSSHSDDDACVILYEEIELADENYEDASEIEAECQAEDGFTSEDLVSIVTAPKKLSL